jgi:hypothetical protein
LLCGLDPKGIVKGKLLDLADQSSDESAYLVIVGVILSVLEVVAMHDSRLSLVCLHFPVVKVGLF